MMWTACGEPTRPYVLWYGHLTLSLLLHCHWLAPAAANFLECQGAVTIVQALHTCCPRLQVLDLASESPPVIPARCSYSSADACVRMCFRQPPDARWWRGSGQGPHSVSSAGGAEPIRCVHVLQQHGAPGTKLLHHFERCIYLWLYKHT